MDFLNHSKSRVGRQSGTPKDGDDDAIWCVPLCRPTYCYDPNALLRWSNDETDPKIKISANKYEDYGDDFDVTIIR